GAPSSESDRQKAAAHEQPSSRFGSLFRKTDGDIIRIRKDGDGWIGEIFTPRQVDLLVDGPGVEPELGQAGEGSYASEVHTNRPTGNGKGTADAIHDRKRCGAIDGHCSQNVVAGSSGGSVAVAAIEFGEAPESR